MTTETIEQLKAELEKERLFSRILARGIRQYVEEDVSRVFNPFVRNKKDNNFLNDLIEQRIISYKDSFPKLVKKLKEVSDVK